MGSRSRYTSRALKQAHLDLQRFYSVQELADIIFRTSPSLVEGIPARHVRAALAQFIRRSVPAVGELVDHRGKRRYLGASLLFAVDGVYPETPAQLAEEVRSVNQQAALVTPAVVNKKKSRMRWQAVAALFAVVGVFSSWGTTLLIQYTRQGAGTFLAANKSKSLQTDKEKYYLANSYYDVGNFEAAEHMAWDLLSNRNLAPGIEGDAFLLLGNIARRQGDYDKALKMADLAHQALKDFPREHSGRLRSIQTLRATVYSKMGDYENSLETLLPLFVLEKHGSYKGYIAYWISEAYFWLGDFKQAFEWNEQASTLYRKEADKNGIVETSMNRAWLLAVLGDIEEGWQALNEAITLNKSLGDQDQEAYLKLTGALLSRCQVENQSHYNLDLIKEKAEQDQNLKAFIEFVEGFDCPNLRIGEGEPPPSGGNDPGGGGGGTQLANQADSAAVGEEPGPNLDVNRIGEGDPSLNGKDPDGGRKNPSI